jgi:hypothetical protein
MDPSIIAVMANPDPNTRVSIGERSVDDMLQVPVTIVYPEDAELQRPVDEHQPMPTPTSGVPNR